MVPDIRRILLLAEVDRHGSMTATAEALNYTTSAISQQIAHLERQLGCEVVRRDRRGVWLTDVGQVLVAHARRVKEELDALEADLSELRSARLANLYVGALPTVASGLLPAVILAFSQRHPEVRVHVRSGIVAELLPMICQQQLDLAVLCEYDWRRISAPMVDLTYLADDPTLLAVPNYHRLADHKTVDLTQVADEHWVSRHNHPMGEILVRASRAAGFEPNIADYAVDFHEAQAMVAMGLGVSLIPASAADRADVRLIPVSGGVPSRRLVIACGARADLSPGATSLKRLLLNTCVAPRQIRQLTEQVAA